MSNVLKSSSSCHYVHSLCEYFFLGYDIVLELGHFSPGVGAGAGAAIFGDLARTTTKKERTTIFSIFMGLRQIGVVIGKWVCTSRGDHSRSHHLLLMEAEEILSIGKSLKCCNYMNNVR